MTEADIFATGGAVTFLFLAGAYVVLRNRFVELYEADKEIDEEPLEERSVLQAVEGRPGPVR